jgi:4-carboxymuconolactone decarboxylase
MTMMGAGDSQSRLSPIDDSTRGLIQIAGAIAGADESIVRQVMENSLGAVNAIEVDEVIIQSYLFAGFPRTLNAARIWRSVSNVEAPARDESAHLESSSDWVQRGEQTCRIVYGESYEMLRRNIRALHPALDAWMITDGYGKVLSREGLALKTRELCIVAACAASAQQRQLHSHLHGALNAGASIDEVRSTLESLSDFVSAPDIEKYISLLAHVASRRHPPPAEVSNVR